MVGDFFAYTPRIEPPPSPVRKLVLIDLRTGQTGYTYDPAGVDYLSVGTYALAQDGDIIFTAGTGVLWRMDGVLTQVGDDTTNATLKTDGVHASSSSMRLTSTWLYEGSARIQLCQGYEYPPCGAVRLRAGWVGYSDFVDPRSSSTPIRVWRRSPSGVTELLDTYAPPDAPPGTPLYDWYTRTGAAAVSPEGELIAWNGTGLHLYRGAGEGVRMSPSTGGLWWGGRWYASLGQSIYELVPFDSGGPLPDGGVEPESDAGEQDAGAADGGSERDAGDHDHGHHGGHPRWPRHFRWPLGCALGAPVVPDASAWLIALGLCLARWRSKRDSARRGPGS
jgi:hypothetical protein